MAHKQIAWNDGAGSMTISYTGEGNDTVTVTSVANQGIDRTQTLTFSNAYSQSVSVSVTQIGRRQPFSASDGRFTLYGGGTFNVIKNS